jgi:hypothetical protein
VFASKEWSDSWDPRRSPDPEAEQIRDDDQPQNREGAGLTVPQAQRAADDEVLE